MVCILVIELYHCGLHFLGGIELGWPAPFSMAFDHFSSSLPQWRPTFLIVVWGRQEVPSCCYRSLLVDLQLHLTFPNLHSTVPGLHHPPSIRFDSSDTGIGRTSTTAAGLLIAVCDSRQLCNLQRLRSCRRFPDDPRPPLQMVAHRKKAAATALSP